MRTAVFPGSFDPFTLAHKELVERSLTLFDRVIIAIGVNSAKKGLMSAEARQRSIESVFRGNRQVTVVRYSGLTVEFCREAEAQFILRGLRNTGDFDFENVIAQNNLVLAPEIETYFLISRSGTAHISSTIVRDIWRNKGNIEHLVPVEVLQILEEDEI